MGKGNRNKLQRAQQVSEAEKYLTSSQKKKNKNETKKGRAIAIVCIVLIIAVVLSIVCTVLDQTGVFGQIEGAINRKTTMMELASGHYTINKVTLNIFFNEEIMSWYGQYGAYASYFGLDFSKDLRDQVYSKATADKPAVSWYEYFLNLTKSKVQMNLVYANAAHDMGLTLDDEDRADIDAAIAAIDNTAKGYGLKYSDFYGEGTKREDIVKYYELIALANKYSEVMGEKYKEDLKKDDSAVIKYPDDHKESFYTADVLKYQIKVDSKGMTDIEYDNAVKDAKERIQKIAAATNADEFFQLILADIEASKNEEGPSVTPTEKPSETATEAASETSSENKTEKSTEPTIDDYKETIKYPSGDSGKLEDWLFGIEEATSTEKREPAKNGETFTEEATETYTEKATTTKKEGATEAASASSTAQNKYKRYTASAYCVYESMHLDTDLTRNLGYFITTDEATAKTILEKFKSGEMSAETLDKLGKEAVDALPSDSKISIGHTAAEQVAPGYFKKSDSAFATIDEWLESEDRKPGDVSDIFYLLSKPSGSKETTKYYAICYLEDFDKEVWYVNATNGVVEDMFKAWYEGEDGNGGQLKSNPATFNEDKADDLYQTYVPYMLSYYSSLGAQS